MECPPIPQFSLDFGLKLIWKRAHLAQALQIGNFHCLDSLRMWWACSWLTQTTRCKLIITLLHSGLHYYKVLSPRCHALFALLVLNTDACNVGPPPQFEPNVRFTADGPFFGRLWYLRKCDVSCMNQPFNYWYLWFDSSDDEILVWIISFQTLNVSS